MRQHTRKHNAEIVAAGRAQLKVLVQLDMPGVSDIDDELGTEATHQKTQRGNRRSRKNPIENPLPIGHAGVSDNDDELRTEVARIPHQALSGGSWRRWKEASFKNQA